MTAVNKTNKIKIETHRGKEDTAFGKHSGSFQLDNIDSKKPNRFGFYRYRQFLDSTYKLGGDRRILSLETFTTVLGLSKNTVRKCIKDLEDKGIITSFSETK
jgi:Fic family protein